MRFRYLLPIVQATISVVFVLVPLWGYSPNAKGSDGREIVCHDNCPPPPRFLGIDPLSLVKGMNLPAELLVFPTLQVWWDHSEHFPSAFWQAVVYAGFGSVLWFFLGALVDDWLEWRQEKTQVPPRVIDIVFSATVIIVPTLGAAAIVKPNNDAGLWLVVCVAVWLLLGYSALAIRVVQWISARRRTNRIELL